MFIADFIKNSAVYVNYTSSGLLEEITLTWGEFSLEVCGDPDVGVFTSVIPRKFPTMFVILYDTFCLIIQCSEPELL